MKPSRASTTLGGPCTPSSASSAAWMPSREAWPACRRLMSAPPLTKANRPADALAAMPSASAICCGVEAAQLGDRDRGAERADRAGRVEAALAQVGRAGAREADRDLVAGDHRLDQLRAADAALVADAERGRNDGAAAMRRADAVAVVELDAVRRRAAEERGVEQVVALGAARHRDRAAAAHAGQHRLGVGRDIARRARDHHADGVEQMPPRVVAHLVGEVGIAQGRSRSHDGAGRARGRMQRDGFGLFHAALAFSLPDRIRSSTGSR